MPTAKSDLAYPDAREALERALASENGVRIKFHSKKLALQFRFSCYTVRSREQIRSRKIYKVGEPFFGRSPWDAMKLMVIQLEEPDAKGYTHAVEIFIPQLESSQVEEI